MKARIHCWCCFLAAGLVAVHPFIHGTPLDSGALDSALAYLQGYALLGGGE